MDFWHCDAHQFNLGHNDALDAITPMKLFFIPHLRMCHSEFKRSSKNRSELKSILNDLKEFDRSFDWKIFYPSMFCLTRWVGFQHCCEILSRKSTRVLLRKYAQKLRDKGFGPRDFDPYKYRRARQRREAGEILDGDGSGSDDDDEHAELQRVHEALDGCRLDADGYQPQPELFASAEEAAASTPSQEDLVAADGFDVGHDGARGRKSKNMLREDPKNSPKQR